MRVSPDDVEMCGICGNEVEEDVYGLKVPLCGESCWLDYCEGLKGEDWTGEG